MICDYFFPKRSARNRTSKRSLINSPKSLPSFQVAALKTREAELEEEKLQVVKTAKEFTVQREQEFAQKLEQLEAAASRKDEQVQELEAELRQVKHSLAAAQREKAALLDASDERDREFEAERQEWRQGAHTDKVRKLSQKDGRMAVVECGGNRTSSLF